MVCLFGAAALSPAAAAASTKTVPLNAQIVVLTQITASYPTGQPQCNTAQFLQVSAGANIASVQAFVDSPVFGHTVTTTLSGPPFPDDHFDAAGHGLGSFGQPDFSFDAPPGTHRWALDWYATISACVDPATVGYVFSNPRAQGVQVGNQLSGKVTDSAGQGVAGVTITAASGTGGTGGTTTTGTDGTYSETLAAGAYTVTASDSTKDSFTPASASVDLTAGDQTQNFALVTAPAISVADVTVNEPTGGSTPAAFAVTLDKQSANTVSVGYTTQDGTATSTHGDYAPTSGTLSFLPGVTSGTVSVPVNATGLAGNRTFDLVLSNPVNATLARATATATITGSLRLDAIKPTSGPPAGGQQLVLTGHGFGKRGDHVVVRWLTHCAAGGNATAIAPNAIVIGAHRIRATVPANPCAKVDATVAADVTVEIFDSAGNPTDSNPQTYTYRPEYVALGDSYSSGLGTGNYSLGAGCMRSSAAYGPLIGAARDYAFTFKACAGATTTAVTANQLGALSSSTTLVTITAGGNDIGFTRVLKSCSLESVSRCGSAISRANTAIANRLPARLDSAYGAIAASASNALVVVLGYPHLFSPSGQTCSFVSSLTSAEEIQLNHSVDLLDAAVAAAAGAHGFTFVDPRNAFLSHDACSSSGWLNGLSLVLNESYHPNVAGQAEFTSLIESVLP